MSDIAIKVENLSKLYRIGTREQKHETFIGALASWAKSPWTNYKRLQRLTRFDKRVSGPLSPVLEDADLLWALKDVSFEVNEGEVIGIIGRNGAGKSTLLKVLSKITEPTSGRALINGRVASLLEVGTGFHPELAGRENIYLNGTILGMAKREIDRKFDEIVDFAEVEKFIDTPVKHYSSGMYVRLAFAVAAHLEPEILLVDEILAVGDLAFQKKCLGKMESVAQEGRTVLFVSHNIAAINLLCERAVLLEKGLLVAQGNTKDCIDAYIDNSNYRSGMFLDHMKVREPAIQIIDARVDGIPADIAHITSSHTTLEIELMFIATSTCRVSLHAFLKDKYGQTLGIYSPGHMQDDVYPVTPGHYKILGNISLPKLTKGKYFIDIGMSEPGVRIYNEFPLGLELQVDGYPTKTGLVFEQSNGNGFQILEGSVTLNTLSTVR